MLDIRVYNEEKLQCVAQTLAKYLQPNMTLLLDGPLGAGKTSFTKGLAKGLNIQQIIKSPTYTFVREYENGTLPLYHMDVYRLEDVGSDGLGLEEYFERNGVSVVEWSQFIADILPTQYLMIHIISNFDNPNERLLQFEPVGLQYKNVVLSFEKEHYS